MNPSSRRVSKLHQAAFGCLTLLLCTCTSSLWAQNTRWNTNPPPIQNTYPSTLPNTTRPTPTTAQNDPRIAALPAPGSNVSYNTGTNPAISPAETNAGKIPTRNLLQVFHDGGWMMYPIAMCSFGLTVFAFERWIALRKSRVVSKPFVNRIIEQLQQQLIDRDEAIELCEKNASPMAKIMLAALRRYGRPAVEVEQAVLDTGERECNYLRRNMRAILAVSNLTPLLGLLGTVLGMIQSFNDISTSQAMGRPEMLAGGISQALLTTAAGLLVAIPAYAVYIYFVARIDSLIVEMDTHAQRLVDVISAEGLQENEGTRTRRSRKAA
ncbi:MAG: MotA/TolQ/ExbB proton channel family protein [Pirellula sp.]